MGPAHGADAGAVCGHGGRHGASQAARHGFGLFSLVSGAALFLASLLAGLLWQAFGSAAAFLCGAALAGLALAGLLVLVALRQRPDAEA